MRAATLALAALATTLTFSTGAFPRAAPRHEASGRTARAGLGPAALRFGRSIGSPTEGHLLGGSHLDETPYLRVVPVYTANDVRWGLEPLVTMIDRAARQVRRQFPDAITSVGHLSREGGGDVDRHRSHESGRDADIGFFIKSAGGRQLLPGHFIPFRGDGAAPSWPGAFFDDAKNWALVSALVTDPEAHVTHLFVAAPLRARLLAYAEHMGVAPAIRVRAAEVLQQPHGALPHDDHFHVRIGCPSHMNGCVENPAMRPRHPPPALAHGRRGPQGRSVVTPAPTAHGSTLPPLPTQAPPAAEPREHDEDGDSEPDAPPAVMAAPVDDVDG